MEAVKSGDKKRVLPAWMTTQETPKPKRAVQGAAAARLSAVRTVYCMSEAEMVDVALGILIEIKELRPRPFPIVTQPASDRAKARTQVLCPVLLPVTPAFPDTVFLVFFSTLARKQEEPWESATPAGADKPELFPARLAWAPSSPGSRSEDEDNGKEAPTQDLGPQQGPAGPDSACRSSPDQDEDEDMLNVAFDRRGTRQSFAVRGRQCAAWRNTNSSPRPRLSWKSDLVTGISCHSEDDVRTACSDQCIEPGVLVTMSYAGLRCP
ncbi:cell cycle regulator of non-homologous end joining isoform X1 [Vulpes lagopus]|uniref:cell cycle regulator of non-homologous end joining isoform X1 n=1 Tax=Vulpes lagopus TaxID=494514 RepID=UPI001BC929E0|nr:cell cycle regulator of non-homologous end joining isoform X1 [Vulpes lagopus]XP_041609502.1 cell cycle regulator of non-homologous end joining isoform X1 [Vulpes lagopus]XP_041609503.1 cell cycle regulator of non-homologous end joining isoform X1 [Vulpes lagopus]